MRDVHVMGTKINYIRIRGHSERKQEKDNAQSGNSVGDPACLRAEPKEAMQGTSLCEYLITL